MLRSTRTLVAVSSLLLGGCFIDEGGDTPADSTSGGSTTDDVSTGSQISAGPVSGNTVDPTTTGISAGSSSGSSGADDSTSSDDDSGSTSSDTDSGDTSDGSSTTGTLLLTVDELEPGDLLITEIMANPHCVLDHCEWFELLNTTELPIELDGLRIGDRDVVQGGAQPIALLQSAVLDPGARGVLAREDLWPYPDFEPLARYANLPLSNGEFETVGIYRPDGEIIDEAADFLPNEEQGRSRRLLPTALDAEANDEDENWCWSDTPLTSTSLNNDWGTPGYDADDCFTP